MSSANRARRQHNREIKTSAAEEGLRRARRQRLTFVAVGLGLAVIVGIALVARATSGNDSAASTTSTTTSTTKPDKNATTTTTLVAGSVADKKCVAQKTPLPAGAPAVPVRVGPPPKQLVKQDLKIGTGAVVKPDATVTLNYIGVACSTGAVFTPPYGKDPLTEPLSSGLAGFAKGVPGMRVGGQRLLGMPPALGYGSISPGAGVAPDETLWFVVDVQATK